MRFNVSKLISTMALAALASGAQAALVYSLASNGGSLIRFDSSSPGIVTTLGSISGAIGRLHGLDFRPADGLLYGYEANTSGIYGVNVNTGVTTLVSTSTIPVGTSSLGIDFNPTVDRLRIVTSADENRRINVATGVAIADGALAYAAGDVNAGSNPLSQLTIASMQDIGYTVNASVADPFFVATSLQAADDAPRPLLEMKNDVRTGPIHVVDHLGRGPGGASAPVPVKKKASKPAR